MPVTEHAPSSRGSQAYRDLARELADRERADRVRVEHVAGSEAGPVMEVRA